MARPRDVSRLRREVLELAERQRAETREGLARNRGEIDELLGSVSDVLPEWEHVPCLFRLALLDEPSGAEPFAENIVLPDVRHDLEMVLDMLNYLRKQKGLAEATMPLFLQPDEIVLALARGERGLQPLRPSPTGAPPELELMRRRGWPLGRRGGLWRRLRRKILDRDGWRCRTCGTEMDLHLHTVDRELPVDDSNRYITLCRTCRARSEAPQDPAQTEVGGAGAAEAAEGPGVAIRSQLALVFQKGAINWVGFVFGRDYVVLRQ